MTDTRSEKVKQIQNNPKIEISFVFKKGDEDCCIRATGIANIIKDKNAKTGLAKHCDFFSLHFNNIDDPNYTLLLINLSDAIYVTPEKATHVEL